MRLEIMSSKISHAQTIHCFLSYIESRFEYIYIYVYINIHTLSIYLHTHTHGIKVEGTTGIRRDLKGEQERILDALLLFVTMLNTMT